MTQTRETKHIKKDVAKVCVISTAHSVFDDRIFHKEAKTLVKGGYDVTLIGQHERDEVVDGVKMIALPQPRNRFTRIFGLTWRAFRLALKQKADLDLTKGADKLWKNFRAETRNQVRQAEKRGVEIYEPKSLGDWLEDYYAMHKAVYSRQSMKPPAKPTFYHSLWRHLYNKERLKIVLAKHEGKIIAGGFSRFTEIRCIFWTERRCGSIRSSVLTT